LQPGIRGGIGTVVRGNNNDNLFGAQVLAIAGLGAASESLSTNPKTYLFFGKNIKLECSVRWFKYCAHFCTECKVSK
jgi:hypothetical protein